MEQIYTQENINNIEEIELLKFRRIKFQLKENKWKEKRYCNLEGFKKDLIISSINNIGIGLMISFWVVLLIKYLFENYI